MSNVQHVLTKRLFHHRRFRNTLIFLILVSILLGIVIVPVESAAKNPRITTIEEGVWWSVTTTTGVGYGDYVPVTTTGRIIGMILEIFGVTMFGLVIGIIGMTMTKRQEEFNWFRLYERIDQLEEKIDQLEKKNSAMVHKTFSNDPETQI